MTAAPTSSRNGRPNASRTVRAATNAAAPAARPLPAEASNGSMRMVSHTCRTRDPLTTARETAQAAAAPTIP